MSILENYSRETIALAVQISQSYLSRFAQAQTAFSLDRDYYKVLGYPETINIDDYIIRYKRQDIASRIVDLPAQDTWKKPPMVSEDGKRDTQFCQDWQALLNKKNLAIWNKLSRADRLSGIGKFGVLVLGFKDGGLLSDEVNTDRLKALGTDGLIYLRPLSEASVEVAAKDEDVQSERFGQPTLYKVNLDSKTKNTKIHWTRILHLADGKLDSEVYGTPRLEKVYNRLDDLTKLIGGGSEASWLNMRQGTLMTPKEGYDGASMDRDKLATEIQEYAHDPLRMLFLEGVETQEIGRDKVMNVSPIFNVAIALISAASGIPQRILIGSAQGELASASEDMRQWAGEVAYRQKNYAEPEILRTFIDRLVQYGVLSPHGESGYHIGKFNPENEEWEWPPLVQMTEKEKAEIMDFKARALKNLADPSMKYPAEQSEVREWLGLSKDVVVEFDDSEDEILRQMNDMKKKFMRGEMSGEQVLNYTMSHWLNVRDLVAGNGKEK